MATSIQANGPKRQPVPAELGGKWIAWSSDGQSHRPTIQASSDAAS